MSNGQEVGRRSSSSAAAHLFQSVGVTACVILVGLVSGIIAARALGVDGRGELAAVILWPAVMTSLAEVGLPTAFTYLAASRGRTPSELAKSIVPLSILQSLVLYAVGIPILLLVLVDYSASTRYTAVGFLLAYAPLYLCVRYLMALSQGMGRMGVYNFARLLIPSLYAVALLGLLLTGVATVAAFAGAYVAAWLVALIALLSVTGQDICRGALSPGIDRATARSAWSIGHRTYFGSLAPIDTLQLDVLLTTSFLGATAAGLYYVATSVGAIVRVWGTTLGALSMPRVAAAETADEAQAWVTVFARVTVICSGTVAVFVFLFARPLLALVYGSDYTSASLLVRVLAVGMLAASLRYVLGDGLRGLGRHTAASRAEIIGWIAGGASLAVFLPLWGVTGVAIAVSVSYGATLIAMLQFCRTLGMSMSRLLVPTRADFAIARSLVASVLHSSHR